MGMLRTTKKEASFYTAFLDVISLTHEAAVYFNAMLTDYTGIEAKVQQMTEYEHKCDAMIHELYARVHAAFITPIDREDIYLLAKCLDDIMDELDESAHLFQVYNATEIKPEAIRVSALIVDAAAHLTELIRLMPNMKAIERMNEHIIEVNRLENQGDAIYREELTKLFKNETDAISLVRWKGIFSRLEKALDACEAVANAIEGVVLKHA